MVLWSACARRYWEIGIVALNRRVFSKAPRKTGNIMARTDKSRAPALAYLRTSSAANVGADKDSERRQRLAVSGFADRAGFQIVDEFRDEAVSGKDPIEGRPGFAALLERIVGNGVLRVVIV